MSILLKNATYVDWESLEFIHSHLLVESGENGEVRFLDNLDDVVARSSVATIDCSGTLVTKSFGIGHHHTYSALARGMPAPERAPSNFHEILKFIWWTLDKCLDDDMVYHGALAVAMSAAKAGSTFVIDHHASPNAIPGALDIIAEAFDRVGVGHLLCYEITDRDGKERSVAGLNETERYLQKRQGLVGLHASFTVNNETLGAAFDLMNQYQTGIHVHVAEDLIDQQHCLDLYAKRVIQRWFEKGLMESPATILVHGLHLDGIERELFRNSPCWLAQNMESNLKNKVGVFSATGMGENIMLGTDGLHSDMLQSARAAYFAALRSDHISPAQVYKRLRNIHHYLRRNNFSGDGANNLIVIDYDSPTNIHTQNFPAHMIFGMHSGHVRDVISNGRLIVCNRELTTIDQRVALEECRKQADRLWDKMGRG